MAFDLNDAEVQAERKKYGPVPMGSKVLIRMEYKEASRNPHPKSNYISVSARGLNMAWVEFTVAAGEYEGVRWRENWMLPAGMQSVSMTEGQTKACSITYSKMRAIVEANRGIDPNDKSAQAAGKRKLGSIMDLNGMTFPAVVGLAKEGREATDRNGNSRVYWDNVVSTIITPNRKEYAELMAGGEWINPEGVTSRENGGFRPQAAVPSVPNDDPFGGATDSAFGSEMGASSDDCPF